MFMKAGLRAQHAEAGVNRCFKYRHRGRYAFMERASTVRSCREWIKVLRLVRKQGPDEVAAA